MLKRAVVASVCNLVVGMSLNFGLKYVFPQLQQEYMSSLFRPFSDPLMMVFFAYPFVSGFALAYLWDKVRARSAMEFAKLYFLVATIPGMFITYTTFPLSLLMVLVWTATGFIEALVAGKVFERMK